MSISFELLSTSASQDEQFNYSYSITYLATVTDRTSEGAAEVLAAAPFTYGSSYAGTPFASAQVDTKDRLANGGGTYSYTASFRLVEQQNNNNPNNENNPFLQPPTYSFGANKAETKIATDVFGKPVVNSANDPFLEALSVEQARPTLTITRNLPYSAGALVNYVNTVNYDAFAGCAPNTLRCNNVSSTSNFDQEFGSYWTVSVELEYNPGTWKTEVLDQGMREIKDGRLQPILENGVPVSQPTLLSGGAKSETPDYIEFQTYYPAPFSFLFFAFL